MDFFMIVVRGAMLSALIVSSGTSHAMGKKRAVNICEQLLAGAAQASLVPFQIDIYRRGQITDIMVLQPSMLEEDGDGLPVDVVEANLEIEVYGTKHTTLAIRDWSPKSKRTSRDFTKILMNRALDLYPNTIEIIDELVEQDMLTVVKAISLNDTPTEALVQTEAYQRYKSMGFENINFVEIRLEDNNPLGSLIVEFGVSRSREKRVRKTLNSVPRRK